MKDFINLSYDRVTKRIGLINAWGFLVVVSTQSAYAVG